MKTRDEVLSILADMLPSLRERHRIGAVELFGSYCRDEQTPSSDVDLAVEFTGPMGFREHFALEDELSEALGAPVDLLDRANLKPRIRERVEREAIRI